MSEETVRIDVWLWRARFFKTRSLAAKFVDEGKVRRNDARLDKASRNVRPGDQLVFAIGGRVFGLIINDLGERRGPASEAQALYRIPDIDLSGAELKKTPR